MICPPTVKGNFLKNVWLPLATRAGSHFHHRKRNNKCMKLFTLTSAKNYAEITTFRDTGLTIPKRVVAWNRDIWESSRLQTEIPITVIGSSKFEDAMNSDPSFLSEFFAFDILNIDITAQDSEPYSGRLERDEKGLKYCVLQNGPRLQVRSDKSGSIRISIDPRRLRISRDKGDLSTENTLRGRLVQLTDEQDQVRALVDVGIPLSVLIPRKVFRDLHLSLGEDVWLICPADGIEVF